jgi:ribosomal protein S3
MKKILIMLIALLPLATFAGNGDEKNEKINIHINTDKNGRVSITGLKGKDLKKLEKEINKALKDVEINVNDGEKNHTIHFKAELNIE